MGADTEDHNRGDLELEDLRNDPNDRLQGAWLCCIPCYWLRRNDGVQKAMLTAATLLVTVVLVASPVIFLISNVPGDRSKDCVTQECTDPGKSVCLTSDCLSAANKIMSTISWNEDPCHDFYQFACGSAIGRAPGEDSNMDNSFVGLQDAIVTNIQQLLAVVANSDPFQKLASFYKSCLRAGDVKTSYTPMLALLNELGGYLPPTEDGPRDLTGLILKLLRMNGASLFQIRLDKDATNSSTYALYIDLPRDFVFEDRQTKFLPRVDQVEQYSSYFTSSSMVSTWEQKGNREFAYLRATVEEKRLLLMEKILLKLLPDNITVEERAKEVQATLLFNSMLSKLYPQKRQRIGISEIREASVTIAELERRFPVIRWKFLFEQAFNSEFSPFDTVYLLCPTYLQSLDKMLTHFQPRVIHNALLVLYAADTLNDLVDTGSHKEWPRFCTQLTMSLFREAVSVLFVGQFHTSQLNELRKKMSRLLDALKSTLKSRINAISWLDQTSRLGMVNKLDNLKVRFMPWYNTSNASIVAEMLDQVHINIDDFFGNVIRRYHQLSAVPADIKEQTAAGLRYRENAFIANAFYIPATNTIMVPLAVIMQPNFYANVPEYIPYSTVGQILAHELLHAFDLIGAKFNHMDEWESVFTEDSATKLDTKLECVRNQYSQVFQKTVHFMGKPVHLKYDWNQTNNENMADISGIEVAFQTWASEVATWKEAGLPLLSLNPQQLFFLSAAQMYCCNLTPDMYIILAQRDTHAPYPERVNGMMMNSPTFASAYQCESGKRMNPKKKCTIL